MANIAFYIAIPFILLFSMLPLPFLYFFSSYFLFPLLFYVVKYRRKVVMANLINAFPEKNIQEINLIEKNFYKYLSDLFVETFKSFTIDKTTLIKKVSFENSEVFNDLFLKNRSVILSCGHIGNYEWMALAGTHYFDAPILGIYRKMTNAKFDDFFRKSRMRFGIDFVSSNLTLRKLREYRDKIYILGLANDQSAPPRVSYWTKFLHQDTSFFVGTEKIAKEYDMAVVFCHFTIPKRGHYNVKFELITDQANETAEGYIMDKHIEMLEKDIQADPQYWLWSHKRWKHKMPENTKYGFNLNRK